MPEYKIFVKKSAEKEIAALPVRIIENLYKVFIDLQFEPRPHGVKKLSGHYNLYRIRIGDYRVIYSIEDAQLVIHVLKAGHRKDVYK